MPVGEPCGPKSGGPRPHSHQRNRRCRRLVQGACALAALALAATLWTAWTELRPEAERALRVELQDRLERSLPEALQASGRYYGVFQASHPAGAARPVGVLLVHGLDEPGTIWNDLVPALTSAGFASWEFRYPNDQGIDRSADLLVESWSGLPADLPMILIGHSMGGLVVRDFVSRWRYPATGPQSLRGAAVAGVILVGTPNQGSDWARLRFWLEPRDQLAAAMDQRFSLLAGLHDGTGAAKIDLRPGSRFLEDLNSRPWPGSIPIRIIGGMLVSSAPAVGDGVVSVDSLALDGAPPPTLVAASHRGMLKRLFENAGEPPAIPQILELLEAASGP
jgi:pimeloyl-ACP methyl ester carboxylesterase